MFDIFGENDKDILRLKACIGVLMQKASKSSQTAILEFLSGKHDELLEAERKKQWELSMEKYKSCKPEKTGREV